MRATNPPQLIVVVFFAQITKLLITQYSPTFQCFMLLEILIDRNPILQSGRTYVKSMTLI
jgi:hypothetical protein